MIGYTHYRIAAALVVAAVLLFAGLAAGAGPVTHTIVIEGTRFEPEMLTAKAGDTVVWINKDPFPHIATAQTSAFDSKNIGPDKSWKYTFRKTGVFPYFCTLHPTMKGTLHVE